jgi:hypothetical protein
LADRSGLVRPPSGSLLGLARWVTLKTNPGYPDLCLGIWYIWYNQWEFQDPKIAKMEVLYHLGSWNAHWYTMRWSEFDHDRTELYQLPRLSVRPTWTPEGKLRFVSIPSVKPKFMQPLSSPPLSTNINSIPTHPNWCLESECCNFLGVAT